MPQCSPSQDFCFLKVFFDSKTLLVSHSTSILNLRALSEESLRIIHITGESMPAFLFGNTLRLLQHTQTETEQALNSMRMLFILCRVTQGANLLYKDGLFSEPRRQM